MRLVSNPLASSDRNILTTGGDGTYTIPNFGSLVYCGLEGWMNPLRRVMEHNDLGHPLCEHLRKGTWAMDYILERLRK
jgi:glycogen debranching enzyme